MSNFTEQAIIRCFGEMLGITPFHKITVSALVKRCGVSSSTFYYHFRDIYDLLDAWLSQATAPFLSEKAKGQDSIKRFFHHLRSHSSTVYHLMGSFSRDRLERYIFRSCQESFARLILAEHGISELPEQKRRDIVDICSFAFMGFSLRFLWNKMQGDIDADVERLSKLFLVIIEAAADDARG